MKLARISLGTQTVLCRIEDDAAIPIQIDNDIAWTDPLREWLSAGQPTSSGSTLSLSAATLLAPLKAPSKIVAIGLNYKDHALEQDKDLPTAPMLFAKAPSAIVGTNAAICFPSQELTSVDYEAELAVVIGRTMKQVNEADALEYVFGYTVANDVTSRDAQASDGQFFRAKSLDTFCPLGPFLVTPDEIQDIQNLSVCTRVNGETRQDSNTAQMVFGVAESLAYISRFVTLEPGDVVLTGTPAGVGAARTPPSFLRDGDTVEVEIGGLGTLTNSVVTY